MLRIAIPPKLCATLSFTATLLASACERRQVPQVDAVTSAAPFASFSPLPSSEPLASAQPLLSAPPSLAPTGARVPHRAAHVVSGKVTVNGRVSPDVVQRTLHQQQDRYGVCYEQGLARDPALAGDVTARFVIGRDGSVSNVSDGGSNLADRAVINCILATLNGSSFAPPEGGIATVVYSLTLTPR